MYYKKKCRFVFVAALILAAQHSMAQLPSVVTSVNKNNILIGEQIHLTVKASMPDNTYRLTWFNIPDSFGNFVVVSEKKIDSSYANGNLLFSQQLTVTSFDSGRMLIPSLVLIAEPLGADSVFRLFTDSIPVNVSFSPLDSVKTFHDIKPIMDVKDRWPWWAWLLIAIGGLLIIVLVFFLLRHFRKDNQDEAILEAKLNPFDEAMQSLDKLEKHGLSDRQVVKEYHAQLANIFRRYISRKANVFKLHLTSGEVLMEIHDFGIKKEQLSAFANCLRTGDAVKFAKFLPANEDSKDCLLQTREMIKEINKQFHRKTEDAI